MKRRRSTLKEETSTTSPTQQRSGGDKARYKVFTQLDTDLIYVSHVLENAIPDAAIREKFISSGVGKSYFVIEFDKKFEDKFELLLGFSSSVISWHLSRKED
jgi:hypothetical protein